MLGVLAGGILSLIGSGKTPYDRYILGASGAVNACLAYFICNFPNGSLIWKNKRI